MILQDILSFVYPKVCMSCENELRADEKMICLHCEMDFSPTHFQNIADNPVFKLFWGKVNLEHASACYNFIKGEKLQELIHEFKYNGHKKLSIFFAQCLNNYIKESTFYSQIDAVVFVPSTRSKTLKRGYNQAEELAKELSKMLLVPCYHKLLIRSKSKQSQTNKNVFERFDNMKSVFEISSKFNLNISNQHILLVDDVVTTGATLEACAAILIKNFGVKVSILTLAYRNI